MSAEVATLQWENKQMISLLDWCIHPCVFTCSERFLGSIPDIHTVSICLPMASVWRCNDKMASNFRFRQNFTAQKAQNTQLCLLQVLWGQRRFSQNTFQCLLTEPWWWWLWWRRCHCRTLSRSNRNLGNMVADQSKHVKKQFTFQEWQEWSFQDIFFLINIKSQRHGIWYAGTNV